MEIHSDFLEVTPEDVASMAVVLASDDANDVTCSSCFVDGGLAWNYQEQ